MYQAYVKAFSNYLITGDGTQMRAYFQDGENEKIMTVYRNGFYRACSDALAANYPTVQTIIGEKIFSGIANTYVSVHPPQEGTLVGYGASFPKYLDLLSTDKSVNSYLPVFSSDIARIDRIWLKCLNSKDESNILTAEHILEVEEKSVDISTTALRAAESLSLLKLSFDILELWMIARKDDLPKKIEIASEPQTLLFWRVSGKVQVKQLDAAEAMLFSSMLEGDFFLEKVFSDTLEKFPKINLEEFFTAALKNNMIVF